MMFVCGAFVLAACNSAPPPTRAEVLEDGPFPNLADVPTPPSLDVSVEERETLYRELREHNDAANAELNQK